MGTVLRQTKFSAIIGKRVTEEMYDVPWESQLWEGKSARGYNLISQNPQFYLRFWITRRKYWQLTSLNQVVGVGGGLVVGPTQRNRHVLTIE